ncbi:EFR1 family ferrodoxin [Candidatus Margulisiibacteriota bacterium]
MKTKIFYFTGTGNTLKLAKDLANELENVELIKISYKMDFEQSDCDIAGIAYPVYCFGLPNIVVNFIKQVNFKQGAYIFGLSSYGALLTNSGKILNKKLKERGYNLSAGFAIQMPGNATTVYNVPKLEKREKFYAIEQDKIKKIAEIIKNKKTYKIETTLSFLGKLMSGISSKMMSNINSVGKSFFIDENCDGCGICKDICPVKNIKMKDNKPEWLNKCESCLACFHWCPKFSIQGNEKTKTRGRYHHPDIVLEDMLCLKSHY